MSFQLTSTKKGQATRQSWSNVAFLVEAMLMLVFLMVALAVFMQMFAAALERSADSGTTTQAVAVGSSVAEQFAADPTAVPEVSEFDDLVVTCEVTPVKREAGTMYYAEIEVHEAGGADVGGDAAASASTDASANAVYEISTSVYVSEVS